MTNHTEINKGSQHGSQQGSQQGRVDRERETSELNRKREGSPKVENPEMGREGLQSSQKGPSGKGQPEQNQQSEQGQPKKNQSGQPDQGRSGEDGMRGE